MLLLLISVVLAALPLLGIVYILIFGAPFTVDGLFMGLILLTISGIFGINALLELRERFGKKKAEPASPPARPATTATAAKPAPSPTAAKPAATPAPKPAAPAATQSPKPETPPPAQPASAPAVEKASTTALDSKPAAPTAAPATPPSVQPKPATAEATPTPAAKPASAPPAPAAASVKTAEPEPLATPRVRPSSPAETESGVVASVMFFESQIGQPDKSIVTLHNGGASRTLIFAGDLRNQLPQGKRVAITYRREDGFSTVLAVE